MIHPLKDGHATVEVQAEGLTAQFDITVQSGRERPIGFVKDVMPILGKAGCNSGPCHGGAKGKTVSNFSCAATTRTLTMRLDPRPLRKTL